MKQIENRGKRKERLAAVISCLADPFKAVFIGDPGKAAIRLSNISKQTVMVSRRPSYGEQSTPNSTATCWFAQDRHPRSGEDFVALKPGEAVEFEVGLFGRFLSAEPQSRHMTVWFDDNGSKFGLKAWIGYIDVAFGEDWTEVRKTEQVEEKWPNGNLKAVGQLLNGERFGEWTFFNEDGDRIEGIHYARDGTISTITTYDLDHPDNKGIGRRPKEE